MVASTYKFHLVPVSKIIVEDRQRRIFDEDKLNALADSISRFGVLNPITINRQGKLIAGERRLRACIKNGLPEIPCHFVEELDEYQLKVMELEENVQREDLTWQEECEAILDYHELRTSKNDDWTSNETADALGISERHAQRKLLVARALRSGDKAVATCQTLSAAVNVLDRQFQRQLDTDMANASHIDRAPIVVEHSHHCRCKACLAKGAFHVFDPATSPIAEATKAQIPQIRPASQDIHNMSFFDFAEAYTGLPFNVLHCDFPYGINMDKAKQGEIASHGTYEDSEDLYTSLISCLLDNRSKLISASAHVYFWFPMKKYTATVSAFESAGFKVNPLPLIWVKTDNTGIIPDAKRGPRQIYETCLFMSLGDRLIIRPTVNAATVPANKHAAMHLSEKPAVVLRQFLSMTIDSTINFLDPTCGAGSALVEAFLAGAASVTGVEINPEHCSTAISALNNARISPRGKASRVEELEIDL